MKFKKKTIIIIQNYKIIGIARKKGDCLKQKNWKRHVVTIGLFSLRLEVQSVVCR